MRKDSALFNELGFWNLTMCQGICGQHKLVFFLLLLGGGGGEKSDGWIKEDWEVYVIMAH